MTKEKAFEAWQAVSEACKEKYLAKEKARENYESARNALPEWNALIKAEEAYERAFERAYQKSRKVSPFFER